MMRNSQFSLFTTPRFGPLFVVQFLGAFNDNLVKTVLSVLIAYALIDTHGHDPKMLVALAAGLFILPFIVFCPLAGLIADRIDKARMIRQTKLAEIIIVFVAIWVFLSGSLYAALIVLMALGVQSAFFSPCKFSILPQHLKAQELVAGNGLISAGTYAAILSGSMLGAFLAPLESGMVLISGVLIVCALTGYVASFFVPVAPPSAVVPASILKLFFRSFISVFRTCFAETPKVVIAILGVAWFYFFAASLQAQFPNFTGQVLGADSVVLTFFMALFTLGVAVGAMLNHKLLKSSIDLRFVPWAALAMAVFGGDVAFTSWGFERSDDPDALYGFFQFLERPQAWRIVFDFLMLAVAAGFYVVPLRAFVQHHMSGDKGGQVISASNVMDAVFILFSAVFAMVLFAIGLDLITLYLVVSVLTLCVGGVLFMLRLNV